MGQIKTNTFWSSLFAIAGYLFPLITYPYVSRVLGVSNIGICGFVDSIINYFALFSSMGIAILAVREVAANRNDQKKLNNTFSSLFLLHISVTFVVLLVLLPCIFFVPQFYEHSDLMMVGVVKLVTSVFIIEWFYKGIEEFRYITIRSVVIRLIYVVLTFIFVRDQGDTFNYYLLTALASVLSALVNFVYVRKYVQFSFEHLTVGVYLMPFLILGMQRLLTSMYTTFNVSFLGFVANQEEVGYYVAATKLYSIIIALFSAFTSVMLPRMSSFLADGRDEEFRSFYKKSVDVLFLFAFPTICFCSVFADQIIWVIVGPGYEASVPIMQIVMPLVFIIGYEQILIVQVLMPMKKDKSVMMNALTGAVVGLLFNCVLVPRWLGVGSAWVWICSEVAVLVVAQVHVTQYLGIKFPYKQLFKYLFMSVPIIAILMALHAMNLEVWISLPLAMTLTLGYYLCIECWVVKNQLTLDLLSQILFVLKSKIG